jgi:hypothetical protein
MASVALIVMLLALAAYMLAAMVWMRRIEERIARCERLIAAAGHGAALRAREEVIARPHKGSVWHT